MTHLEALPYAVDAARLSACQSKRGVVIWREDGWLITGYNDQPAPLLCDSSDTCKRTCGRTAVHAEQRAMLGVTGAKLSGSSMLHVKVAGRLAPIPVHCDGPSCLECSKLILEAGIAWMWLLLDDGWQRYSAAEFHALTLRNVLGLVPSLGGPR